MIGYKGLIYTMERSKDREDLHTKIDEDVVELLGEEVMKEEDLQDELSYIHKLISEKDEDSLAGVWFGELEIVHWVKPVEEFLDDMGVKYARLLGGQITLIKDGREFLLTRYKQNRIPHLEDYEEIFYIHDGLVREGVFSRMGMTTEEEYYLTK